MKKSVLFGLTAAAMLLSATFTISAKGKSSEPDGLVVAPESTNVKILGRTFTKNNVLYLTQSASAVEFEVEAKSVVLNLVGDTTARPVRGEIPNNLCRIAIYVNDELKETLTIDSQKKAVTVINEKKAVSAKIRVAKLTESAQSMFGIKEIVLDKKGKISPVAEKALKIEFIGDSITCGYGVEAANQFQPFTTQTENAEKAYAYLTAKNLDADYSIVSYSGFGIYSGYTGDGNRNTTSLVPTNYENIAFSWSNPGYNSLKWDFAQFVPNLIVVNLGTNDVSYCKNDSKKRAAYKDAYVEFLKDLRAKNPDAYIIATLGIMGDELYSQMESAVATYSKSTGDARVCAFYLEPHTAADGYGADWHPSEKTQQDRAQVMTEFIQSLIDSGEIK